jgi:hypothetical protein
MLCAAALTFAGAAFAQQPPSDHSTYVSPDPDANGFSTGGPPKGHVLAREKAVSHARAEMRQACAAERQTLCSRKTFAHRVDQCLYYYRTKVSRTCRQAQDGVEVAARDGA